ncbi:hypothetical protein CXF68_08455 [Tenacibaculum sp. Bg11-29]|uniref:hypothetical protein n=1 Tax=Tenacibaculum sp. Bg11-29 TaxID=2058306 RepID=UPI000C32B571|nr:hypothetical protein [Tenacibaculum sp. Bg11-29]PKH50720.1 hypothetical protein CXF68_08455 [Tenacibaculum sp. Bg11-29]
MKTIIDFENNKKQFTRDIVYDGIVDTEEYYSNSPKILWILKEVNCPGDSNWDMRDALANNIKNKNGKGIKSGWANTFNPIVYATYGILNNISWENMESVYSDQSIIDVLRKVAYINVKKEPGGSSSNPSEIKSYYNKNKAASHEQIKLINPDIIIFGNTLNFFDEDFFDLFEKLEKKENDSSLEVYEGEKHILLNTYHPNNRTIEQ